MTVDRLKTEECLWCGATEGQVALRERRTHVYECVDRAACDDRIRSRLIRGGVAP